MLKNFNVSEAGSLNYRAMLEGTGTAFVTTLVLILLTASALYYSSLSESSLPMIGNLIVVLASVAGGIFASYRAGQRGLYHGVGVGLMFTILCMFVCLIFYYDVLSMAVMGQKLIFALLGGSLGGILGVAVK